MSGKKFGVLSWLPLLQVTTTLIQVASLPMDIVCLYKNKKHRKVFFFQIFLKLECIKHKWICFAVNCKAISRVLLSVFSLFKPFRSHFISTQNSCYLNVYAALKTRIRYKVKHKNQNILWWLNSEIEVGMVHKVVY